MKQRYMELYRKMAESKDVAKMRAFGDAEVWIFGMLADKHQSLRRSGSIGWRQVSGTTTFQRVRLWKLSQG